MLVLCLSVMAFGKIDYILVTLGFSERPAAYIRN